MIEWSTDVYSIASQRSGLIECNLTLALKHTFQIVVV